MPPFRPRVLVVEDDRKTADWLQLYLDRAGCEVQLVHDGVAALDAALGTPPDLVLLDLMLPGLSGLEVCRRLRESTDVPIIVITARTGEEDRLRGFDVGADDYIGKPFSPREVVARVQAVLRRTRLGEARPPLVFGGLSLDEATLEASVAGRAVRLTPIECRLLVALLGAPRRVFTRAELVRRALGDDYEGTERTIDAHVKNLRRKIEPAPAGVPAIETVHGVGYRLVLDDGTA